MDALPKIEAIPENLLRAPLDFLFADHFRQMLVCNYLDAIAEERGTERAKLLAATARAYLTQDLPLHIADEETDLFPRLRRLAQADAALTDIFAILADEHREDLRLATPLLAGLEQVSRGLAAAPDFASTVAAFTAMQRRHIIWENSIVLPHARRSLTDTDLESVGRGMAARRSVEFAR